MPEELIYLEKHIVVTATIHHINDSKEPGESFRNCFIRHHPEGKSSQRQNRHLRLTNPRISKCKGFFEEDAALVENPGGILGTAQRELSKNEKFWISQNGSAVTELIQSLFSDVKKTPHFLLLK